MMKSNEIAPTMNFMTISLFVLIQPQQPQAERTTGAASDDTGRLEIFKIDRHQCRKWLPQSDRPAG